MKNFIKEFKEFINRGNVMDMAVGVIIGGAFQSIINSVVNDVVMPLIAAIFGGIDFSNWFVVLGKGEEPPVLHYGNLITAVINFILMALVIFLFVKGMNSLREKTKKPVEEVPAAPTTKVCPFCKSEVAIDATRCPHCTSELESEAAE